MWALWWCIHRLVSLRWQAAALRLRWVGEVWDIVRAIAIPSITLAGFPCLKFFWFDLCYCFA